MRFVALYCASGPYRHVRRLVEEARPDWFPWGYRSRSTASGTAPVAGDEVELWEVDDTRRPSRVEPLVVASVDYASTAGDYLAMTLRPVGVRAEADPAFVLRQATAGRLLARLDSTAQAERGRGTVGAGHGIDAVSNRSPVSSAVAALSLGE